MSVIDTILDDLSNKVPSKMLAYPEGSKIESKKYYYGEILNYNASAVSRLKELEFFLEGISTHGFDKDKLLFKDYIYINLLRKGGISDKFKVNTICPMCNKPVEDIVSLEDISIPDIDIPSLPVYVKYQEMDIEFSPITVSDYIYLFENDLNKDITATKALLIKNMDYNQAYDLVKHADNELALIIEEVESLFDFGPRAIRISCNNSEKRAGIIKYCGNKFEMSITSPVALVSPFRGDRDSIKDRIRFSK